MLVAEALIRDTGREPDAPAEVVDIPDRAHLEEPGQQRLDDVVRHDVSGRYKPVKGADLQVSFFHRSSTDEYIDAIAALDAVTLYTGTGTSREVGTPLSDSLMAGALRERLHVKTDLTEGQQKQIVGKLMKVYPPAYLGSIAKEFVRRHSRKDPLDLPALEREAQNVFTQDLEKGLVAGRDTGGFLAHGLGALAFALRKAGKSVQIMTTNYDDRIDEEQPRVHKYFTDLRDYSFKSSTLDSANTPDSKSVPLYSLNGQLKDSSRADSDPLIIGEADALTDHYEPRSRLLMQALMESSCVFVGSSLTEPDVLAKLVNTPYRHQQHPRYALVLPGRLGLDKPEDQELKAAALNLIADRFRHLGVVPIIIDFPHQAPQFLIEAALRLEQGSAYENYPARLDKWWGFWAKEFGFGAAASMQGGKRSAKVQEIWWKQLEKVRHQILTMHLELPAEDRDREEQIQVEVWLRNPQTRSLVLWASSEGMWLHANTAHTCSIYEGNQFAVQRAFREGAPIFDEIERPRGIWQYHMSFPLVLRKKPWYHLPVGVVSVLSNKPETLKSNSGEVEQQGGKLGDFAKRGSFANDLAAMVSDVRKPLNELLDPGSSLCSRKKIGAFAKGRRAGS